VTRLLALGYWLLASQNLESKTRSQKPGARTWLWHNRIMPLFEYECRDCGKPFEAFVTADRVATCPSCEGTNLRKLLSRLGMVGVSSSRSEGCAMPSSPVCGGGRCGCAD
jgi:putative FmdB family regulatory protein